MDLAPVLNQRFLFRKEFNQPLFIWFNANSTKFLSYSGQSDFSLKSLCKFIKEQSGLAPEKHSTLNLLSLTPKNYDFIIGNQDILVYYHSDWWYCFVNYSAQCEYLSKNFIQNLKKELYIRFEGRRVLTAQVILIN